MDGQWSWGTRAPAKIEGLMTELGLRPNCPERDTLYRALRDFHADPVNRQRLDMKLTVDETLVNTELQCLLRKIGDSHFGRDSRAHLTPQAPIYHPKASREEQAKTFQPLRRALMYCCQRWRQEQKKLSQRDNTHTRQGSPNNEQENVASQNPDVWQSTLRSSPKVLPASPNDSGQTLGSSFNVAVKIGYNDEDFAEDDNDKFTAFTNTRRPWVIKYDSGDEYPYGTRVVTSFQCNVYCKRLRGARNHEWFVHWKYAGIDTHLPLPWSGRDRAFRLSHHDGSVQLVRRGAYYGAPLRYVRPPKESKDHPLSNPIPSHTTTETQMHALQNDLGQQPSSAADTNETSEVNKVKVKGTSGFDRREPGDKSSIRSSIFLEGTVSASPPLSQSNAEKKIDSAVQEPLESQIVNPSEAVNTRTSIVLPGQGAKAKVAAHERPGLTSMFSTPITNRLSSGQTQDSDPQVKDKYRLALEARKALVVSGITVRTTRRAGRSNIEEADHGEAAHDEADHDEADGGGEEIGQDGSVILHSNVSKANTGSLTYQAELAKPIIFRADSTVRLSSSSIHGTASTISTNPVAHLKRAAADEGGSEPRADMLLSQDQDVPHLKRQRLDSLSVYSKGIGGVPDHQNRSSSQSTSQPTQRPTPRRVQVQLCIQNHRGGWVEWPHGRLSTHTVQTLFEKFAECSNLRCEPEHINFFLADAKRKREFGIARGDEAKFEDMKERIGIIIKDERHKSDFQVHMEADVKVESDEEVEYDW